MSNVYVTVQEIVSKIAWIYVNWSIFFLKNSDGLCFGIIYLVSSQNFPENISYPLIRTSGCAYQGVKNSFFLKILRTW